MSHPPPDTTGILDEAYLSEMQRFIGPQALGELLATAPASFRPLIAEAEACWQNGALEDLREVAHRLAGAAASIGAQRLAAAARRCQNMPNGQLDEATVRALGAVAEEALAALADYLPR